MGLYYVVCIKQWLGYLCKEYIEVMDLFSEICVLKILKDIVLVIICI